MDTTFNLRHKECQQSILWFDNKFWNDLPNPSDINLAQPKNINGAQQNIKIVPKSVVLPRSLKPSGKYQHHKILATFDAACDIKRKYFIEWKHYARKSKGNKDDLLKQKVQEEKLLKFLDTLNSHKQKLKEVHKSVNVKPKIQYSNNTKCYEHRFEAQQNIIEFQKLKLVQQEKIIEQLKLNRLNEEINLSIEQTENDLKQAFLKCSSKRKFTVHPVLKLVPNDNITSIYPTSNKAPKIVQEMECRALEREERRQIILHRKRVLEEKRKETLLMEIERKKTQEEEVRKENLKAIKERRRKELEHQKMIQTKKQEFLEKCTKAECFYRRCLKSIGFAAFSRIILIKYNNLLKSEIFYETYLKRKYFNNWIVFINEIYNRKYFVADNFYNLKMLRKLFSLWFSVYTLSIQNLQVAEDLYEMRLHSKIFFFWHRYTCTQYILHNKNLKKAQRHYNSHILLHYFYQWKSLPAVLKIEKAKEEKKQRWREKVWEILPDYNPIMDDL